MTGVAFRIHVASLIHLVFLLRSLSIMFAFSQSMMHLFLSAWSVIADLCCTVANSLPLPLLLPLTILPPLSLSVYLYIFCSLVNRLVLMFFESCSKGSPRFADTRMVTTHTKYLVITVFLLSSALSFGYPDVLMRFNMRSVLMMF